MRRYRRASAVVALLAVAEIGVAGCSGTSDHSAVSSTTMATSVTTESVNPALAQQVPPSIRSKGTLTIATDVPYAPLEFTRNGQIVGFDMDVITEAAHILDLRPDIVQAPFGQIVDGVDAGQYDVGARSIFDTFSREAKADMVTYFAAGTQWAQQAGHHVDPNNACGLKVAVQAGTVQANTEIPAKGKACTTLGDKDIAVITEKSEADAVDAVLAGRADAVSLDSPVTAYAVQNSGGTLVTAGSAFDTDPYAFAVAKGSTLGKAVQGAVQSLIESGAMERMAARWGLEEGLIATSLINGATN